MTTRVSELRQSSLLSSSQLIHGRAFDVAMIAACGWLIIGGFLDAWAHNHIPLETFFTPWHVVLYSGFLAVAVVMVGAVVINRVYGCSWDRSVPVGYELSLLAVPAFALGGVGDMLWHTFFGIEKSTDAILSPTHLVLMICFGVLMAGPFRALWRRSKAGLAQVDRLLAPVAMAMIVLIFSLITQELHPYYSFAPLNTFATQSSQQMLAIVGMILETIILMSIVLLALKRWQLPLGSFTFLLTINAIALSFMQDHYLAIPMAAVAGLLVDILYQWLRPSVARVSELRIFAAAAPAILYLVYFLALSLTGSIVVWSIHLVAGSIIVSGITGWLLSYLLAPPQEYE
ncbi:MAG: hypothetical protein PVS3B1_36940 [Ktedonobacteraceae bacterium]